MSAVGRLVAIWRYPVKSMIGEELNSTEMTEKGVLGDRAFGLWDVDSGVLANAKNVGRWPDMFSYRSRYIEEPRLRSVLPPVAITLPSGDVALSNSVEAPRRLSQVFGRAVALRRLREGASEGQTTTEARQAPDVHIVTTSSLRALQAAAPATRLESRRFRPNLVIESAGDGYVENGWVGQEIAVGDVILRITERTRRCNLTTFAQGDLPQESVVLQSICEQNEGYLGVYAHVVRPGFVRRGEDVYVI